jgi:hypothetical protein
MDEPRLFWYFVTGCSHRRDILELTHDFCSPLLVEDMALDAR